MDRVDPAAELLISLGLTISLVLGHLPRLFVEAIAIRSTAIAQPCKGYFDLPILDRDLWIVCFGDLSDIAHDLFPIDMGGWELGLLGALLTGDILTLILLGALITLAPLGHLGTKDLIEARAIPLEGPRKPRHSHRQEEYEDIHPTDSMEVIKEALTPLTQRDLQALPYALELLRPPEEEPREEDEDEEEGTCPHDDAPPEDTLSLGLHAIE